jgi:hypothetical protein
MKLHRKRPGPLFTCSSPSNGGFSRGALARRLPPRLVSYSPRLCVASGVTAQSVGCKRCWVADCGVYGLPASTSNLLAESCAWPPCHRAFSSCPPEQPRHQTFRIRVDEAWRPQRKRRCPVAAGRSAAHQVDTEADSAQTWRPANITLFSFKNRGRSGHTTLASAAARWRAVCLFPTTFLLPSDGKRRDSAVRRLQALLGGGLRRLRPACFHLETACSQLRLAPMPQSVSDAPARTA